MRKKEKIQLEDEKRREMIQAIKHYFSEQKDEEWGELASGLLLNFIIDELAPEFYNQGIYDAYKTINDRTEDLLSLMI